MKIKSLVIMAMLAAILFVGQVGMAFLPNIEVVTLLVIVYTKMLGKKVFYVIYTFAFLEGLFYGFGLWWVNYLYVWSILAVVVLFLPAMSTLAWSVLSGAFGLSFGLLCSIPFFITAGWEAGLAYWISGLPFDIFHCLGNIIVCVILYKPVLAILRKVNSLSGNFVQSIGRDDYEGGV